MPDSTICMHACHDISPEGKATAVCAHRAKGVGSLSFHVRLPASNRQASQSTCSAALYCTRSWIAASAGTCARHKLALHSKLFLNHGHFILMLLVVCIRLRKHPWWDTQAHHHMPMHILVWNFYAAWGPCRQPVESKLVYCHLFTSVSMLTHTSADNCKSCSNTLPSGPRPP